MKLEVFKIEVAPEDADFKRLVEPHALDGVVAAFRVLDGLPESRQRTAKEQVHRLLSIWNQTGPDARSCFLLLNPTSGRRLTKEQRSIAGSRKGGGSKRKTTVDWSKVQAVASEESQLLRTIGEPVTKKALVPRLKVNQKTSHILAKVSPKTIERKISVRTLKRR